MRNVEADRRAKSLQLRPRLSCENSKWRIVMDPPMTDMDYVRMERMQWFADYKARTLK